MGTQETRGWGSLLSWKAISFLGACDSSASKHTIVRAKYDFQASQGKLQLCSQGWGFSRCPPGLSPLRLAATLIMQWGRNSEAWQGLNIASQATCGDVPLNLLKSRGWHVPWGTALCFKIKSARLSLMGPRSFLLNTEKTLNDFLQKPLCERRRQLMGDWSQRPSWSMLCRIQMNLFVKNRNPSGPTAVSM